MEKEISISRKREGQIRSVAASQGVFFYELTRKQVKNVNLRIDKEGRIKVSAPAGVSVEFIEGFIREKEGFIRKALKIRQEQQKVADKEQKKEPTRQELIREKELAKEILTDSMTRMSRLVAPYGIFCRQLQIRRMTSRWGSCIPVKGKITLNSRLVEAPIQAIDYVVLHELAHMKYPHHQKSFYEFIAQFMPDWKVRREMLKKIR